MSKVMKFVTRYPLISLSVVAIIVIVLMQILTKDGQESSFEVASEENFIPSKHDERLLALDKEAADNAYREQIEHLFATWMKSPGDKEAPRRARTGAQNAREAYIAVMEAIEKREKDLLKLKQLKEDK